MRTRHVLAATAALALAGGHAGAASRRHGRAATRPSRPSPRSPSKLVGPLSVAQAPDGTRYWSDNFAGVLYKQTPAGGRRRSSTRARSHARRAASPPTAAVLRFATGSERQQVGRRLDARRTGGPVQVGDTWKDEKKNNPDGKFHYGFLNTPKSCHRSARGGRSSRTPARRRPTPTPSHRANGITYVADAGRQRGARASRRPAWSRRSPPSSRSR